MSNNAKYTKEIQLLFNLKNNKKNKELKKKIDELANSEPTSALLNNICGFFYIDLNYLNKAEDLFKKSILLDPKFQAAYHNLGLLNVRKGLYNEAIKLFEKSIILDSKNYDSNLNLGLCYKKVKDFDNAIIYFNNCISINPNLVDAYNNISLVYISKKDYPKAEINLHSAIKINPNMFGAYNNLGLVFIAKREYFKAVNFFQKAIQIKNDYFEAYGNLAMAYYHLEDYDQAIQNCSLAINHNKSFAKGYWIKSIIFKNLGKYAESLVAIKKAINLDNKLYQAFVSLITIYCETFKHNKAAEHFDTILNLSSNDILELGYKEIEVLIFHSMYLPSFSYAKYKKLTDCFQSFISEKKKYHKKLISNSNNIIKLGFVSADFRQHVIMFQILGVFEELKKNKEIQIYAFSNTQKEDDMTKKLKNIFHGFHDIKKLSDEDAADLIFKKKIDILFDLSSYTLDNRLGIFTYRPAPIQATWAGYAGSTGLKEIDFIFADKYVIPKDEECNYSEKLVNLETWSILTDTVEFEKISKICPFEKNNYITFGSLNKSTKITEEVIKVWSSILNNVHNSKLLLKSSLLKFREIQDLIYQEFEKNEISRSRLILEAPSKRTEALMTLNKIDIVLDPFPYTGGTTNLEAVSMCVPVLTKMGNSFVSRCGESVNNNIGMSEWIAKDNNDLINKAIFFSKRENLIKARNYLLSVRKDCILFSPKKFTNKFLEEIKKIVSSVH